MHLKTFCAVIFFFTSTILTFGEPNQSPMIQLVRNERSFSSMKDASPKNEFAETPAVSYVRDKVYSLEASVKLAKVKLEHLSKQNNELEKSMHEQNDLLKIMAGEFSDLEQQLSEHGYQLNDFDDMTGRSKNLFILSNQTCGGVLAGQSGSILFSRLSSVNVRNPHPSSCVWTIQANNRAFIKLSTRSTYRTFLPTFVLEIIKTNVTGNGTEPQVKITNLQKNFHHVFAGPTIFVVSRSVTTDMDLHIQFEGMGKMVEKTTFFTHEILQGNPAGTFNSSELKTWSPSLLEQLDGKTNYTLDYTTIVVSNFSTKVHLQAEVGNGVCSNGESFIVINDVIGNNASVTDCCKTNCHGRNSLINYDNPLFILITKKFQKPLDFKLTWEADPKYPSESSNCGEVLGGVAGTIRYKTSYIFGKNERCIWVIVPQPRPTSAIYITMTSNGILDTDDHLYMMELTDIYGEELPDAPKITRMERYATSFVARSREVYFVFYSDFAIQTRGFSLTWRTSVDAVKSQSDVTTQFSHFKINNGLARSTLRKATFTSDLYQVFIFTPSLPQTYTDGLQLQLNKTHPVVGENDCIKNELTVFTPLNGILAKTQVVCNNSGEAMLSNGDGMVVAVMKSQNRSLEAMEMNFKWNQDLAQQNRTEVVVQNDQCGGVIIGNKGVLKYKLGRRYLNQERCVWLLNSPNSINITFKLDVQGFSSPDYVLVTPINPKTGLLSNNETKRLYGEGSGYTMSGSMMVIVFRSDSTYTGKTGFSLQFLSRGHQPHSDYSYKLRHISESHGTVEYDADADPKDIYVIASSMTLRENGPTAAPISVNWSEGVFKKANDSCIYDTLTFYEPASYSWLKVAQLPYQNDTSCPDIVRVPEIKKVFSLDYSAYVAIYKPVSTEESRTNMTQKSFKYNYFTTTTHSACGGTLREDYGQISYKDTTMYSNNERCIWIVEIPQAVMISFYLESSGLEVCCDVVSVASGIGLNSVPLSLNNRTVSVMGQRAVVKFTSDSTKVGTGFRLRYENITELTFPSNSYILRNCRNIDQAFSRLSLVTLVDYSSNCVWTIRANNSARIKVSIRDLPTAMYTIGSSSSININTYVVETIRANVTGNSTSSSTPQITITKLNKNAQYEFAGPTIFVVTSVYSNNDFNFKLLFEGVGELVHNDTFFTHETLLANSGNFSNNQLDTWNSSLVGVNDSSTNYTLDYTTLVVSNFSTYVQLQATVGNCSNEESFIVISYVTYTHSEVTDCCKTNCEGNNSLINYGNPFVILITKKFQEPFNFSLAWEAEPAYPSSNDVTKCGEVLGGTNGTIKYKENSVYGINERCIWVIVPQPLPRSSIIVNLVTEGINDSEDLLYMMELTDANGEVLLDGPKITRLSRYRPFEAHGREVYIVFYSNSEPLPSGSGFYLTWRGTGDVVRTENDVATAFTFLKSDNGSLKSAWKKSLFTRRFYQTFIFTPGIQSIYSNGLKLTFNKTLSITGESNCTHDGIQYFAATYGFLTKTQPICANLGEAILEDIDGMAVILMSSQHNVSSEVAMDFKWRSEYQNQNSTDLILEDDKCGGVMVARNGILNYKLRSAYLNDERCLWLLYSPNSTSINLKLLEDGFEKCCDYILATTIDPETGTLRNNSVKITRDNRTLTLEDPMVVPQFRSDKSVAESGFSLRFLARGNSAHDYNYKLRHGSEPNGTFEFPGSGWLEGGTGKRAEIYVMASSIVTEYDSNEVPRNPITINWSGGVFHKANDSTCTYDSLTLYEPVYSDWLSQDLFPNRNTSSCVDAVGVSGKKNIFSSNNPAFLAVYKPTILTDRNLTGVIPTRFSFYYHLIAISFECGGVLEGEYGAISYKEYDRYANNENCVWQIEVPQAERILFHLEGAGFEKCCDYLTVTSNGSPPAKLTSTNGIATIMGSSASVTFTSDSSVIGNGFRLRFENSSDVVVEGESCGGVIFGDSGVLNYKFGMYYPNNERCVWLLHSPNNVIITLNLVQDGFERCCDGLLINTVSTDAGIFRNDTVVINRENNTRTITEPLVVIVFYSDHSTRGKGFSLQFSTSGNNLNPDFSYKLRHVSDAQGIVTYPSTEWSDAESTGNEIVILAHSSNVREGDELSTINLRWTGGEFRRSNESCDYDSLKFYTTPSSNGWRTREILPNENYTSLCSDVVNVPPKNLFSTEYSSLIAIYKPVSARQLPENVTRFGFTYEEGAGCGGVIVGTSGTISYKEDGKYSYNEQCIWLIEVPRAETIFFHLETGELEVCCDFITISSVSFRGIDARVAVITPINTNATVDGPVVIVTFTSDGSVIGRGFRLAFNTSTQATEDSPYTYSLAHRNQPDLVQFSQQVNANQVAIFASTHHYKFNSQINITSFRPQVNESCYSDSLTLYTMLVSKEIVFDMTKRFTALDTVQGQTLVTQRAARHCTTFEDHQFSTCSDIGDCSDAPTGNILNLNTTSFVTVYSSVNVSRGLQIRGFALTSEAKKIQK